MTNFLLYGIEKPGPRPLVVPPGATQFSELYRGLPLGVYTALRTFEHNKFLWLDRHLARTERSLALTGMDYTLDRPRLLRALHEVVSAAPWPDSRVRIDLLAGPAGALGSASRELIALQPFTPPPAAVYERGVVVDFAAGLRRDNPLAKTAAFAAERPLTGGLKQLERGDGPGAAAEPYELLLVGADGRVLEGTGVNFWAMRDGVVYTAGAGVLEGITREIILRLISELGIPLRLEAIHVDEIATLDEAALSGSSRAVVPAVNIAGHAIGSGRPGPITKRLLAAYNEFVAGNIRTAVEEG